MLTKEKVEQAKALVHLLTNNSQQIMGYLELGQIDKALVAAKAGSDTLKQLSRVLGTAYDHERPEINTEPKQRRAHGVILVTGGTKQ